MGDIAVQETKELSKHEQAGLEVVTAAQQLPVETAVDMELASAMRENIKDRHKDVTEFMKPLVDLAHKAHKALTTRRAEVLKPFDEAETILNEKMVKWQIEEDVRLIREQRIADEKAKEEAFDAAAADDNEALAEAIADDAVVVTAAPVEKSSTSGVSFGEKWSYKIEDESKIPAQYLMPNEKLIKSTVTAMKGRAQIAGVRIYPEKTIKSKPKGMSKRAF